MAQFAERTLHLEAKTGTLGQTIKWDIPRDLPVSLINLNTTFTVGTVAATLKADGLLNLIKEVRIVGNDGETSTRVKVSGSGLIELFAHRNGALDRNTLSLIGVNTTGAKTMCVPVPFAIPGVLDPTRSLFLLPTGLFQEGPRIEIDLASQADIDSNGTPTFALTGSVSIEPLLVREFVTIRDQPYMKSELVEDEIACASAITGAQHNLVVPGTYTALLLRGYQSATARGDISGSALYTVNQLTNTLREWKNDTLQVLNDYNRLHSQGAAATNFSGSMFVDFLNTGIGQDTGDFGSALNTSLLSQSGVQPVLKYNVSATYAGANCKLRLIRHRVLGDTSALVRGRKLRAAA